MLYLCRQYTTDLLVASVSLHIMMHKFSQPPLPPLPIKKGADSPTTPVESRTLRVISVAEKCKQWEVHGDKGNVHGGRFGIQVTEVPDVEPRSTSAAADGCSPGSKLKRF